MVINNDHNDYHDYHDRHDLIMIMLIIIINADIIVTFETLVSPSPVMNNDQQSPKFT